MESNERAEGGADEPRDVSGERSEGRPTSRRARELIASELGRLESFTALDVEALCARRPDLADELRGAYEGFLRLHAILTELGLDPGEMEPPEDGLEE